jgi:hypothetical protein
MESQAEKVGSSRASAQTFSRWVVVFLQGVSVMVSDVFADAIAEIDGYLTQDSHCCDPFRLEVQTVETVMQVVQICLDGNMPGQNAELVLWHHHLGKTIQNLKLKAVEVALWQYLGYTRTKLRDFPGVDAMLSRLGLIETARLKAAAQKQHHPAQ